MKSRSFRFLALLGAGFFVCLVLAPVRPVLAEWEINDDTTWRLSDSPIVATEWVAVREGAKLTIEPGVVVKFAAPDPYDRSIFVQGQLDASGTSDQPIIFTTIEDDVGGDTNGDGMATSPAAGAWWKIAFQNTTGNTLSHVVIRYGGANETDVLENYRSQLTITDSTFTKNIGTIVNNEGELTINNSSIFDNLMFDNGKYIQTGINNQGGATVNATSNWWGTAAGPCPWQSLVSSTTPRWKINFYNLCGARPIVDANVVYDPWLKELPTAVKKINPVIVIPGIMGSWQDWQGVWQIDPILHTYDDLLDALRLAGYEDGETLFTFPYQWRQSNVISAQQLKDKVQLVKAACKGDDQIDCSKVDLIGHSMGGLVARAYIEGDNYQSDIDQMIFIATPHRGAPKAYLMWEGGELDNNILANFIIKKIFEVESELHGYKTTVISDGVYQYVKNEVPAVQQLLPIYSYLRDKDTGVMRDYPNGYPVNSFLETLNSVNNLSKLKNVTSLNLLGTAGATTISSLRLVDSPFTFDGKWGNGIPENYNNIFGDRGLELGPGDNTVPASSNSGFNGLTDIEVSGADHSAIVAKAQKTVIKALTGKEPTTEIYTSVVDRILMFRIFSPADFEVIAPDGRRLGRNISGAGNLFEITDGFYSGYASSTLPEFVVIPNPLPGNYQVKLIGTESGGSYRLASSLVSDSTSSESNFSGQILAGSERNVNFSLDNGELVAVAKADITIESAISDISGLMARGLLTDKQAKQKLIQQYQLLQVKVKIFDLTLKLADAGLQKLVKDNKLKTENKVKLLALAQKELDKLKSKRLETINEELNKISELANNYRAKGVLKQLGYDIIKANNDYLKINWQ